MQPHVSVESLVVLEQPSTLWTLHWLRWSKAGQHSVSTPPTHKQILFIYLFINFVIYLVIGLLSFGQKAGAKVNLALSCVCVCAHMRVCVCVCVHICVHACVCMRVCACMCVHVCMHAFVRACMGVLGPGQGLQGL